MENEKKKISCSYALLVIILFAALAFVTDYAIIERKTRSCNCPKCEFTNNGDKNESSVIEESNEQVSEMGVTFSSFSGKYISDNGDKYTYINFSSDGTWNGSFNYCEGHANLKGKYVVDDEIIVVRFDESSNGVGLTIPEVVVFKIVEKTSHYPTLIRINEGFGFGCVYSDSKFSYSYGE